MSLWNYLFEKGSYRIIQRTDGQFRIEEDLGLIWPDWYSYDGSFDTLEKAEGWVERHKNPAKEKIVRHL